MTNFNKSGDEEQYKEGDSCPINPISQPNSQNISNEVNKNTSFGVPPQLGSSETPSHNVTNKNYYNPGNQAPDQTSINNKLSSSSSKKGGLFKKILPWISGILGISALMFGMSRCATNLQTNNNTNVTPDTSVQVPTPVTQSPDVTTSKPSDTVTTSPEAEVTTSPEATTSPEPSSTTIPPTETPTDNNTTNPDITSNTSPPNVDNNSSSSSNKTKPSDSSSSTNTNSSSTNSSNRINNSNVNRTNNGSISNSKRINLDGTLKYRQFDSNRGYYLQLASKAGTDVRKYRTWRANATSQKTKNFYSRLIVRQSNMRKHYLALAKK